MRSIFLLIVAIGLFILITPFAIVFRLIRAVKFKESISDYLFTIALGIDQLGAAILYQKENWTVSSYTYLLCVKGKKFACKFMKLIDLFFGKEHCKQSFINESKEDLKEFRDTRI